eukprot:GHVH01002390.1.p1 GENE.GHVH01002390.1~~GHVH01002390.1.p1  ORF type:complete len:103 (-),score=11.42 GHVH01002390.1:157-465(-)
MPEAATDQGDRFMTTWKISLLVIFGENVFSIFSKSRRPAAFSLLIIPGICAVTSLYWGKMFVREAEVIEENEMKTEEIMGTRISEKSIQIHEYSNSQSMSID